MNTYPVHFAHTGERQRVTALDWRAALRTTGRPDACLLEKRTCLSTGRISVDATFGAGSPTTITCRTRDAGSSDADLTRWALACVAHESQAANAGAGEVAECQT